MKDQRLPFSGELSALTADSAYSACQFISQMVTLPNLVLIVRARGNRTVYRGSPTPLGSSKDRGHPVWYGKPFNMKDPTTWGEPDTSEIVPLTFSATSG